MGFVGNEEALLVSVYCKTLMKKIRQIILAVVSFEYVIASPKYVVEELLIKKKNL